MELFSIKSLEIDGAIGGGSVLRLGIPLAIALGYELRVTNVRKFKKRPGLQVQHITGLNFLSQITGSQLMGASIGSSEVYLSPGKTPPPVNMLPKIQIPTAAAVSLVIQTLSNYVFASRLPMGFEFEGGGTHVAFSPNFDVLARVNKPLFELFGLKLHIQLMRPGFYPQGGALGKIFMEPCPFSQIVLKSGELDSIDVVSSASADLRSEKVAESQIRGFKSILKDINKPFAGYAPSINSGYACSSIIKYKGNSIKGLANIGGSNITPDENGKLTAQHTLKELENLGSVDEQLADQLILPLAYSPSGSSYTFDKMYPHIKTNLEVIEIMMGNILQLEEKCDIFHLTKI